MALFIYQVFFFLATIGFGGSYTGRCLYRCRCIKLVFFCYSSLAQKGRLNTTIQLIAYAKALYLINLLFHIKHLIFLLSSTLLIDHN